MKLPRQPVISMLKAFRKSIENQNSSNSHNDSWSSSDYWKWSESYNNERLKKPEIKTHYLTYQSKFLTNNCDMKIVKGKSSLRDEGSQNLNNWTTIENPLYKQCLRNIKNKKKMDEFKGDCQEPTIDKKVITMNNNMVSLLKE